MSKMEWAEPVTVSSAFSDEQKVRVHALRIAAEVVSKFRTSTMGGSSAPWPAEDMMALLLSLADWIVNPEDINRDLVEQGLARMLSREEQGGQS